MHVERPGDRDVVGMMLAVRLVRRVAHTTDLALRGKASPAELVVTHFAYRIDVSHSSRMQRDCYNSQVM